MLSRFWAIFSTNYAILTQQETGVTRKSAFLEEGNRFGSLKRLFTVIYRSDRRPNCHLKACGVMELSVA